MTDFWPHGYSAAAAFTFDVDAESAVLAVHPEMTSRMSLMSHQAYGPKVGLKRLLAILNRREIRSTFFVPGFTADCYPDSVRMIVDAGHEVAHHGYLHESTRGLSLNEERACIDRGLDALDRLGVRPVGYRAPWWELNWHTPELLADRGFEYDSSLFDDDRPYRFRTGSTDRTLVEIPVDWALDDWEQYAFFPDFTGSGVIEDVEKVHDMWTREAVARHAEGLCFVLTCHPCLTGRPARAATLERVIEEVQRLSNIWVTTLQEIAAHVATHDDVRTHTAIHLPAASQQRVHDVHDAR